MKRLMYRVFAEKVDPKNTARLLEFQVGVAFATEPGTTFRLQLDAIPLNFDGRLTVHLDDPVSVIENGQEKKP